MDISYLSSTGQRLELDKPPYHVAQSELFDFAWSLGFAAKPLRDGGKVISRRRPSVERSMTMYIYGQTRAECARAVNRFCEVTDTDVQNLTPGRLWYSGQYLTCYIGAAQIDYSDDWRCCAKVTLTVTPENPCWCSEVTYSYSAGAQTDTDTDGFSYPYSYPRRYSSLSRSTAVINDHYASSPMIIKIYGEADTPRFSVAGALMGLNVRIEAGEYAVIDQYERTVYKVTSDGERINIFNSRLKNGNIFKYAPAGASQLDITGSLNMDITLIKQRSEPEWS